MVTRPNTTADAAPAPPIITEEFIRGYFTYLSQNGSLPATPPAPPPAIPTPPAPSPAIPTPTPAPATEARNFNRAGRGTGGALKAKQLASKQVTAPAVKRKAPVDPGPETLPSTSESIEKANPKPQKRRKIVKVSGSH